MIDKVIMTAILTFTMLIGIVMVAVIYLNLNPLDIY